MVKTYEYTGQSAAKLPFLEEGSTTKWKWVITGVIA
jgi:hypothetical protein